jgi:hypothetical protein
MLTKPAYEHTQPKLDYRFSEFVSEPELLPLLAVIKGLMKFLPSERMSARDALKLF